MSFVSIDDNGYGEWVVKLANVEVGVIEETITGFCFFPTLSNIALQPSTLLCIFKKLEELNNAASR